MSGGHFEYRQYHIEDIAREIDELVKFNEDETLDEYGGKRGRFYPPEVLEKFIEASHWLKRSADMVQRIDWLVSCDDSEKSFMKRWEKEVRKP